MIIIRQKAFSIQSTLDEIKNRLNREGICDFDISQTIPRDCISLTTDLKNLTIYLPDELEYSQFGIESFIRSMIPYARTTTSADRDLYIMKLHGKLTLAQYIKLVKYIIEDSEFCVILDR